MENNPKFSIIIPAYNSEKYISKALESVYNQEFKNYELIVVCDSCVDRTPNLARYYGATVYEVNFGCDGPSRNYGLERAHGEWILFMDDDDWFLHEYVLFLLDYVVGKNGEDILAFSFIWRDVGYAKNTPNQLYIATWNKCWRRSAIGDTRFGNVRCDSDIQFHEEMMAKNPKIVCWDMPMYYYNFLREGSQTYNRKIEDMREYDANLKRVVFEKRGINRVKNIALNEEA